MQGSSRCHGLGVGCSWLALIGQPVLLTNILSTFAQAFGRSSSRRLNITSSQAHTSHPTMANQVAQAAMRVKHELHGVVVSAGLMQKTVKVRVGNMTWNKMVKKVCWLWAHPYINSANNVR